jgi:DNA-binding transcriptional LysR family regulator
MDIQAIQLFADAARSGSFAAVARERGLAPSSVSRSVALLEEELGARLFQRSTRRLVLTEAGTVYLEQVAPLLQALAGASAAASDVARQPHGALRVTTSNAFGLTQVVPMLPAFTQRYPDVELDLHLTDAVVDLIAERFDLAVRLGSLTDSSLIAVPLLRMRYRVCASPGYLRRHGRPREPGDLAGHACLRFPLPGFRSRWRFRDLGGAEQDVAVGGRIVISNALGLLDCALADAGVVLLAEVMLADALRDGRLVDLFPDHEVTATDFDSAAWFVYPSRDYVPLKVRVFMQALREAVHHRMAGAALAGLAAPP